MKISNSRFVVFNRRNARTDKAISQIKIYGDRYTEVEQQRVQN